MAAIKRIRHCVVFLSFNLLLIFCASATVLPDTVIKNDGSELKGLVVEDYTDRVIFSTADGEATIMKNDINKIYYDEEEQNLLSLARQHYEKGKPTIALQYVDMALQVNPNYEEARVMRGYISSKIIATKEDQLLDVIERQKKVINARNSTAQDFAGDRHSRMTPNDNLKNRLGLEISSHEGWIVATYVSPASPAFETGLKAGDRLISIGGSLIRYWPIERVAEELTGPRYSEILLVMERDIPVEFKERISGGKVLKKLGMKLSIKPDGLTVEKLSKDGIAIISGLNEGDLLVKIDDISTRYLSLKKAEAVISGHAQRMVLTVRRRNFIWRK